MLADNTWLNTRISGENTVHSWIYLTKEGDFTDTVSDMNNKNLNSIDWEKVNKEILSRRLKSRYLKPIKKLKKLNDMSGAGFSIMVIACSLIEFLQSTKEGKMFSLNPKVETDEKYFKSGKMFKKFLTENEPFKSDFSGSLADDFYVNIRCALLHNASTKDGWKIKRRIKVDGFDSERMICQDKKEISRDMFVKRLKKYIKSYKEQLLTDQALQSKFIRKFDSYCDDCKI